ncbi:hypothetical protein CBR_g84 [Chara braunii]|uniref:CRAL-TRIO domain-containing protein n=1 Tax=Chara braunii TaxID=69332 RepID=A0A388JLQ9_CHABU|nr:hypothetical protein CBR_g84 [Chara braunii]|eukprot:GBG58683.1 hypothetical protein CBR_g84 [Chara braunii]
MTGVVADEAMTMTPCQRKALEQLRAELSDKGILKKCHDDYYLGRFLTARNYDVSKSRHMFESMLEWRERMQVDTLKTTAITEQEKKTLKELYPHFHHKTDKLGRPIYIEQLGRLRLDQLLKITTIDQMVLYHVAECEALTDIKLPACSKKAGRRIGQSLTILDLKGVNFKQMTSTAVRAFLRKIAIIDQDYYPEYLGNMVIINASSAFKTAYSMIRPWLDKRTQKKIEVVGSSYAPRLLELADAESLPDFLGGTCRCEGGCQLSDAGPWKSCTTEPIQHCQLEVADGTTRYW